MKKSFVIIFSLLVLSLFLSSNFITSYWGVSGCNPNDWIFCFKQRNIPNNYDPNIISSAFEIKGNSCCRMPDNDATSGNPLYAGIVTDPAIYNQHETTCPRAAGGIWNTQIAMGLVQYSKGDECCQVARTKVDTTAIGSLGETILTLENSYLYQKSLCCGLDNGLSEIKGKKGVASACCLVRRDSSTSSPSSATSTSEVSNQVYDTTKEACCPSAGVYDPSKQKCCPTTWPDGIIRHRLGEGNDCCAADLIIESIDGKIQNFPINIAFDNRVKKCCDNPKTNEPGQPPKIIATQCPSTNQCDQVYGPNNYIKCGNSCCDKVSEQCCAKNSGLAPTCCPKTDTCTETNRNVGGINIFKNSCSGDACAPGKSKCTTTNWGIPNSVCCDTVKETCTYVNLIIEGKSRAVAYCKKKLPNCPVPCGTDGEGKQICCDSTDRCETQGGAPICQANSCKVGDELCKGNVQINPDQTYPYSICCPKNTCLIQPDGFPKCVVK